MICSKHFVGNTRSNDPRSPSYVPSLFPKVYKKKLIDSNQADERYKRILNRKIQTTTITEKIETDTENGFLVENNCTSQFASVGIQVSFDNCGNNNFNFSCIHEGNSVSTQACIPFSFSNYLNCGSKPTSSDKACGVDHRESLSCLSCEAFHGFESIKNEKSLKHITGTFFQFLIYCSS